MATLIERYTNPTIDGAEISCTTDVAEGTVYYWSKTTPFTGDDATDAADIIANGVPMPVVDFNPEDIIEGQPADTQHYLAWVQDIAAGVTDPAITNILADPTTTTVTITWTTDIPATSRVDYGLTSGYGSNVEDLSTPRTSHSIELTGLTSDQPYHFSVTSTTAEGGIASSADDQFATLVDYGNDWVFEVYGEAGVQFEISLTDTGDSTDYDAMVTWGDGTAPVAITDYWNTTKRYTYGITDNYIVRVSGKLAIPRFIAANAPKILRVLQQGHISQLSAASQYASCVNMTSFTAGNSDMSLCAAANGMFSGCTGFTTGPDLRGIGLSSANKTCNAMFDAAGTIDGTLPNVSDLDMSGCEDISLMFRNYAAAANSILECENWTLAPILNAVNFIFGWSMSVAQYDAILAQWKLQTGVDYTNGLRMGTSQYSDTVSRADLNAIVLAGSGGTGLVDGGEYTP